MVIQPTKKWIYPLKMMIKADVRNKNDESSSEHMDFTRKNTCKRKIGIFAMKNVGAQFDVIIKNCQKMGGNHQKVGFDQVGWYYKMIVSSQVDHLFACHIQVPMSNETGIDWIKSHLKFPRRSTVELPSSKAPIFSFSGAFFQIH